MPWERQQRGGRQHRTLASPRWTRAGDDTRSKPFPRAGARASSPVPRELAVDVLLPSLFLFFFFSSFKYVASLARGTHPLPTHIALDVAMHSLPLQGRSDGCWFME